MDERASEPPQKYQKATRGPTAARVLAWGVGAVILSVAASGCTGTSSVLANMPEAIGGLPQEAPVRPAASDQTTFPAVHDMPPPRPNSTLTPEQVKAIEAEMTFARERQKKRAGAPIADDPPAPAADKSPAR